VGLYEGKEYTEAPVPLIVNALLSEIYDEKTTCCEPSEKSAVCDSGERGAAATCGCQ